MRKVKVKISFHVALSLRDMLLRYEEESPLLLAATNNMSATKRNMVRMYQTTLSILLFKLSSRTHMVWPKEKTVSFTLPEAYALTTVLRTDFSTDFELAAFSSLLLQIEPQLP